MNTNSRTNNNSSFALNPFNIGGPAREDGFFDRKKILKGLPLLFFPVHMKLIY
jgi:hypothetical protein